MNPVALERFKVVLRDRVESSDAMTKDMIAFLIAYIPDRVLEFEHGFNEAVEACPTLNKLVVECRGDLSDYRNKEIRMAMTHARLAWSDARSRGNDLVSDVGDLLIRMFDRGSW